MATALPPPSIRWDVEWTPSERALWLKEAQILRRLLSDLAQRGRARLAGVGELHVLSADEVRAPVRGSRPYEVCLWIEDGEGLVGECTCPASGEEHLCKHMWAVLDRLLVALKAPAPVAAPAPGGIDQLSRLLELALAVRDGDGSPGGRQAKRIVWRVRLTGTSLPVVEAYEQQRRDSGAWTPGRRVSLEQLGYYGRARDESDIRAVSRLIDHTGYGYGYGQAQVDGRLALEALEGSPRVVDADEPERALRVVRGEVAVRLAPDPAGLRLEAVVGDLPLTFAPEPSAGAAVAFDRAAGLVVVGRAPRRAQALLTHLARRPLVIPRSEGAAVLVRLPQLERVVPLQVPPEAAGPVVDADARPRLLLEPRGPGELDGLRASLRVRPLDRGAAATGAAAPDPGPAVLPGEGRAELLCLDAGGLARARRDLAAEAERARGLLTALGLAERAPTSPWTWELDLEASLALLGALRVDEPPAVIVEWPQGERLRVSRELDLSSFHVAVRDARDWFQLEGGLDVDGERIELALVLNALRRGERHVALAGGRFLRLSDALRGRLEALRGAAQERRGKLELDATAAPVVVEALEGVTEAALSRGWRAVLARLDASRKVSVRVPRGLKAELRDYQREGWAWLKRLSTFGAGACLADDMGLGKTVQTIAALLDRAALGPALVVAPTSVGPNWARELQRFAPSLRVTLLRDTSRDRAVIDALGPRNVVVTSYDLARIDAALLERVTWATLVLDEAQRVKNARTKTADALSRLDAGWRLALTGTPVENRLSDLWSLFRIVSPGLLGAWEAFRDRFAVPIERDRDPVQAAALARLLRPYVLRRTKEQVLTELPPRAETTLEVTLSKGERALYEDARLEAVAQLEQLVEQGDRDARFHVLAALTRLRQLACHPGLVEESWRGPSAKLTALVELVRELVQGGHRALVFSQFTGHLALVRAALDAEGVAYHYLDGRTPARARQVAIDAFQKGEHPLFLVSLKAGGVGLNLTGADYVLHLDPWWNPAVEDQATGRAHRLGQQRPVSVYRFVAKGTVEEQILALHADKRALVTAVLDGTDRAGALSTDELVGLIRGEDAGVKRARPTRSLGGSGAVGDRVSGRAPKASAARPPATTDDVRALRSYLGLTQRQLGELVGASQTTVCHWEQGLREPGREARERLARLRSTPPTDLIVASAGRRAAR